MYCQHRVFFKACTLLSFFLMTQAVHSQPTFSLKKRAYKEHLNSVRKEKRKKIKQQDLFIKNLSQKPDKKYQAYVEKLKSYDSEAQAERQFEEFLTPASEKKPQLKEKYLKNQANQDEEKEKHSVPSFSENILKEKGRSLF